MSPNDTSRTRAALGANDEPWLVQTLRLVAAGQDSALRELYDATLARAFGVARSLLGDASLAEEALASAYAQIWRDAAQYNPARSSVRNWIAMIVRARAIDLRRRVVNYAQQAGPLDAAQACESPVPNPATHADACERERLVRRALETLPVDQRVALEAAFFGGLTHTEVALKLGAPLGTIKSRIRSGLSGLRHNLASLEVDLH
ncbi:MAG: sigma-70 family RNA polymerase sigma factor [Planctomycetota bacterium]